jgi:two-component system response regulator FixJ
MSTKELSVVHAVVQDEQASATVEKALEGTDWGRLTYSSVAEYLQGYTALRSGCVLVEVATSGAADLPSLWGSRHALPVVVIAAHADVETAVEMMKGGAFDCLELPLNPYDLRRCIAGAVRFSEDSLMEQKYNEVLRQRVASLSAREREVMRMLAIGAINKVIASRLGLSRRTVETHRRSVMRKMEAASVAELIGMSLTLEKAARPEGRRPAIDNVARSMAIAGELSH